MTSMDKMGMAVAIGVVAVFLGFTATGGSGAPSDIPQQVEPAIKQVEVIREDLETKAEKIKEAAVETKEKIEKIPKDTAEILEEPKEATEKGLKKLEELTSAKASIRKVSIPEGTAVPGCEKDNLCYDPAHLIIFTDTEVIWKNDDTAAHTVTSGSPQKGPSGVFDSSLILADDTFTYKFDSAGVFDYFCMVHPWMVGTVTVE
jgi:plastocyanin